MRATVSAKNSSSSRPACASVRRSGWGNIRFDANQLSQVLMNLVLNAA
jgi:signal transduction histidine kinase